MRRKLETIFSFLILVILMFFVGFTSGKITSYFAGLTEVDSKLIRMLISFFIPFIFLLFVVIVHIFIHELGHMIFGLISGYKLLYFRIGSYCIVNTEEGTKFRRLKIPGTSGQCIMVPPAKVDGKYPFTLYNLGGGIANIILVLVSFIAMKFFDKTGLAYSIMQYSIYIGIYLAILNLIPLKSISNDGANLLAMKRNKLNRDAFYTILNNEVELVNGRRPRIIKLERNSENLQQVLTQGLMIDEMEDHMNQDNFLEAMELGQLLLKQKNLNIIYRNSILTNLESIYILFGDEDSLENLEKDKNYKKHKRYSYIPSLDRTKYLESILIKKQSGSEFLDRFNSLKNNYIYPASIELDHRLMGYGKVLREEREKIQKFESLSSTNDLAKTHAEKGHYPIIIADRQENGKGQNNNSFYSPKGGLYLSYTLSPNYKKDQLPYITARAALATKKAIESSLKVNPEIKWINDLFYNNKKIGGILTESKIDSKGNIDYIIIGVGINLQKTEDTPENLKDIYGTLDVVDYKAISNRLLFFLFLEFRKLKFPVDIDTFLEEYNKYLYQKGENINIIYKDEKIQGKLIGVNNKMDLVLDINGEIKNFSYNNTKIIH